MCLWSFHDHGVKSSSRHKPKLLSMNWPFSSQHLLMSFSGDQIIIAATAKKCRSQQILRFAELEIGRNFAGSSKLKSTGQSRANLPVVNHPRQGFAYKLSVALLNCIELSLDQRLNDIYSHIAWRIFCAFFQTGELKILFSLKWPANWARLPKSHVSDFSTPNFERNQPRPRILSSENFLQFLHMPAQLMYSSRSSALFPSGSLQSPQAIRLSPSVRQLSFLRCPARYEPLP